MEDYIIAPDLLKEMQQDGLIDPINEDIEPKPQPLPNNTILSVTKKMINNQINNQNNIINNQASLIPEVSESQENTESVTFNYNSSSIGNIKNRNDFKLLKQNSNYNEMNYNLIKEEKDEEDNNEEQFNNKENYEIDEYDNLNDEKSEEKGKEINYRNNNQIEIENNISQEKAKTELLNTSISNEEIEPLYNNLNTNHSLTPVRHRKFKKNKSELFLNKKSEIKDIQKLQNELNMLTKQFSKIDKSLKRKNEELKKIKLLNDDLLKENNAQKKIIDTINNEKVMLNSKIISLKDYCNKVESKLVGGSKNQHLIEINNKLRLENESLINQIKFYESDKNDLMKNNELLQDELNLLKTEFQTFSERNNNKINIGKNLDNKNKTAKLISELTQEKKINKKQEEEIKQLKYELNKKDLILQQKEEEIQSINYGKSQMTSIIAQKENEIHNLIIERDSFQKHYQECNNQLKNLKDKLKENEEREENNKASFKLKDQYEAVIKKYINEISSLKKENNKLNDKLKDNENIIKEYDLVLNDKNKIGKSQNFEELISKLELEMNEQIKNKKNWINNDKEIFNKLNEEKEKSLKLINDIETLII
jgi:hypothetical protein